MTSPLLSRLRHLWHTVGLGALVAGLAALTGAPPAVAQPVPSSASLTVEWMQPDASPRVVVTLPPGSDRAAAEMAADEWHDPAASGELTVRYEGGQIQRRGVRRDRLPAPPPPPSAPPPPPGPPTSSGSPRPPAPPPSAAYWNATYSASVEPFVDPNPSASDRRRAVARADVAGEAMPPEGLTTGTAQARFRIDDQNLAIDIEVVSASSDDAGRFVRFLALATVYRDGAAGKTGTLTVTMGSPGGN